MTEPCGETCTDVKPTAPTWRPVEDAAQGSGILPVMMIGVGLDARLGLPFDQLRAAGREAGRLGFESLWTPAGGVPDAFHVCAAWSQDTSLRTGISVVPAARDRGAAMPELVDAASEEMLQAVGYYGPAVPAPAAFARLSAGLDEAIVRIVTARPPTLIRDAKRTGR